MSQNGSRMIAPHQEREHPPVRVMLVDDHEIMRDGLAFLLESEPGIEIVAQAQDGVEALKTAAISKPDIILMDITMPRMDGIEATRRLSHELPQVRIIGLSMHEEQELGAAMRQAGAVEYVMKGGPSKQLLAAIHRQAPYGQTP